MKMRPLVILAIVTLLVATGCATVTFKPGAGPGGAKADEDACRATSETQAGYVACLRERGWMVGGKAAEPGPRAKAAESAGAPAATPAKPSTAAQTPAAGAAAKSQETTPPAEGPGRAPSGEPGAKRPAAGGAPETVAVPPAETKPAKSAPPARAGYPDPEEPAEEAPLDPDSKINVSSWWKVGGTASDLDRAVGACVDELGASHQPNPAITEVTVALKDCLRAKKWIAVGGTGPL